MMEAGKGLWSLIQDQILGMKWLKDAVGAGLTAMGTDISSRLGGSVHFFISSDGSWKTCQTGAKECTPVAK